MNNIDDILESLKGQQPIISDPDALTDSIMDSLPDLDAAAKQPVARVVKMRWLWTAAASLILIIGIGTIWQFNHGTTPTQDIVAKAEPAKPAKDAAETAKDVAQAAKDVTETTKDVAEAVTRQGLDKQPKLTPYQVPSSQPSSRYTEPESPSAVIDEDPNLHYAAHELAKDTVLYQDPARVDEFIAKLADYNKVKKDELVCSVPSDSNVVSAVYVFPDKQEADVFGHLLQMACWYKSETPGYRLTFTNQQFFFELKDMRKQLHYRWIAERINGKILLYSSHAPIGAKDFSPCYQEYRNELMHINSINIKTKKI